MGTFLITTVILSMIGPYKNSLKTTEFYFIFSNVACASFTNETMFLSLNCTIRIYK